MGLFHKIDFKIVGQYTFIPKLYKVLPINIENMHCIVLFKTIHKHIQNWYMFWKNFIIYWCQHAIFTFCFGTITKKLEILFAYQNTRSNTPYGLIFNGTNATIKFVMSPEFIFLYIGFSISVWNSCIPYMCHPSQLSFFVHYGIPGCRCLQLFFYLPVVFVICIVDFTL